MESDCQIQYRVIGMMSGTSLDGVDLAFCVFTYQNKWTYTVEASKTYPYSQPIIDSIIIMQQPSTPFLKFKQEELNYSQYISDLILTFINQFQIQHIDFISLHGHTIFHHPKDKITVQVTNLPLVAANTGLDVVGNFRELDVMKGGEGAPLAPFGDELFQGDIFINFGGVANIGCTDRGWDINFCNLFFNFFAKELQQLDFDPEGEIGRGGQLNQDVCQEFRQKWTSLGQVSLEREKFQGLLKDLLSTWKDVPKNDILTSYYHFLAEEVVQNIKVIASIQGRDFSKQKIEVLCSGGGAYNSFLLELIRNYGHSHFNLKVGSPQVVQFKEAIIFAFLGVKFMEGTHNCKNGVGGLLAKGKCQKG